MYRKVPRRPNVADRSNQNVGRRIHSPQTTTKINRQARSAQSPIKAFSLTIFIGLSVLLTFIMLSVVGFYGYYQLTDRIIPGVYVGNTYLSGYTLNEAAIELQKSWNLDNPIVITNGLTAIEVTPAELGLSIDPIYLAQRAYDIGHREVMPMEFMQMIVSITEGWVIDPNVQLDQNAARVTLESFSPQLSQAPINATLYVEGDQIFAIPGEFGFTINIEASMDELVANLQHILDNGELLVTLMPVLPAVMDASTAALEAQTLIAKEMSITGYDAITDEVFEWPIDRMTLASWITVEAGHDGPIASFDSAKITGYFNQISRELGQGRYLDADKYAAQLAQNLRTSDSPLIYISHYPTKYTVQPGDTLLKIGWKLGMPYWMILQANPGIDPDALWAGAELNIPSKDDLVPLPIVPGKRIVLSISKQHMWIYQDGTRIKDFVISTGIDRSPTQPGIFQVQTHDKRAYASVWDLYMPNFLGVYEAWPGFMNGIHGLPTLSNGRRLWANILGRPASYGCIILDLGPAEWLYDWADDGVIVEITP